MANKTPTELVKALADWMDAHAVPETDWDKVMQAALAELDARHQNDEQIFEDPAEGFRRGWRDMLDGNTIPASKLLDALNDET